MDPTPSEVAPRDTGGGKRSADGILRNATFGLLAQISTSAFTAVLTLYLVRKLNRRATASWRSR